MIRYDRLDIANLINRLKKKHPQIISEIVDNSNNKDLAAIRELKELFDKKIIEHIKLEYNEITIYYSIE